jgi:hypothetical protein
MSQKLEFAKMDMGLQARLRFSDLLTRFATSADRGEAIKALHLLTDDFQITSKDGPKPKGALANVLMMRQISEYTTRHHVSEPIISSFSEERICGVAPIVSYKVEDGKMTIGVVEFTAEIVPSTQRDGSSAWKIHRLTMAPYASTTIENPVIGTSS